MSLYIETIFFRRPKILSIPIRFSYGINTEKIKKIYELLNIISGFTVDLGTFGVYPDNGEITIKAGIPVLNDTINSDQLTKSINEMLFKGINYFRMVVLVDVGNVSPDEAFQDFINILKSCPHSSLNRINNHKKEAYYESSS